MRVFAYFPNFFTNFSPVLSVCGLFYIHILLHFLMVSVHILKLSQNCHQLSFTSDFPFLCIPFFHWICSQPTLALGFSKLFLAEGILLVCSRLSSVNKAELYSNSSLISGAFGNCPHISWGRSCLQQLIMAAILFVLGMAGNSLPGPDEPKSLVGHDHSPTHTPLWAFSGSIKEELPSAILHCSTQQPSTKSTGSGVDKHLWSSSPLFKTVSFWEKKAGSLELADLNREM